MFPASINLSTLNGNNGARINGIAINSALGFSVSNAGDVNGDGIADLIVGAPGGNGVGQSYVVFGRRTAFAATINPSDFNGNNGSRINGINAGDFTGGSVSGAGDVNGDGIADLLIGAAVADPNGTDSGQSYVVFGRSTGFGADINLADLNGNNGARINGINAGDNSGRSVSNAGDVNGDGVADMLIGANGADPNGTDSGQSYVVFGRRTAFAADINLADLNGNNGARINGINPGDLSGTSVSGAGDVNGDGIADMLIGAFGADPNGTDSGQTYVVFGRNTGFAATINPADFNGSNGARINGIRAGDNSGFSVSNAGDVNADGIDDIIIGAPSADPNGADSGQSYVVFGRTTGFAADINLADLNGSNGARINGIAAGDRSGASVSGAGDVNGDGVDDLLIGAPGANPNGRDSGQSFVVFGRRTAFAADINLADLNGSNGFRLDGIAIDDQSGFSVSGAGDVNGDGADDLVVGAPFADPNGVESGQGYIVFGMPDPIPGLTLTPPTVDASGVTLGSVSVDLNAGKLTINATPRLITRSITGFTNVLGTGQNDLITGSNGVNALNGNAGDDTIIGNEGNDVLNGGVGNDTLTGGVGNDRFVFSLTTRFDQAQIGIDTITDFTRGQDKILLDRNTFNGVKKISFASVKNRRAAQRNKATFTYIRSSGELYFNANGNKNGFGRGGQFADLTDGLNLKGNDLQLGRV
jgi:Ca2+-binding RTX toxin-like protein